MEIYIFISYRPNKKNPYTVLRFLFIKLVPLDSEMCKTLVFLIYPARSRTKGALISHATAATVPSVVTVAALILGWNCITVGVKRSSQSDFALADVSILFICWGFIFLFFINFAQRRIEARFCKTNRLHFLELIWGSDFDQVGVYNTEIKRKTSLRNLHIRQGT